MRNVIIAGAVALLVSICGCKCSDCVEASASTKNANVLIIGVSNSPKFGKVSGSKKDVSMMKSLTKAYAAKQTILQDKNATRANVLKAMNEGVNGKLFIMYFSGHGTHTYATTDKTEKDGQDEYICCYDEVVSDNEIWSIISKSKGRVFLIFDCCHSGTMYKVPQFFSAVNKESGPINMICWSACPDSKYGWGNVSGAFMTRALKKSFNKNRTYDDVWKRMESDSLTKKYETIQCTKMGKDFGSTKIFQ